MKDQVTLWIEESKENEMEFLRQQLIIEVAEEVSKKMEEREIKRSALAKLLGKTTSYITQLLTGSRNMTLSTLSDLAFALNGKVRISIIDKKEGNEWSYDNMEILLSSSKSWPDSTSTAYSCNDDNVHGEIARITRIKAAA
ncbi:helix-turn-helix domain-containing protein [Pseudomonas indica]|uniref:helix-turn-helix domain-containing protein n=1 Tax=Pseudomonas indica TaxID=137658 RepID=UPI003FCF211C